MLRVFCPRHEENTPSCVVYDEYAFCYGGCGRIPLEELGEAGQGLRAKPSPADLNSELARIGALPCAPVRGLSLPVDGDSYYIVWPGNGYYKRRKFIPGEGPKYLCPRGHKKPLFVARKSQGQVCAIVEGEINALSLAAIAPPYGVVSPGGVGDFKPEIIWQNKEIFGAIKRYYVILDKDSPGLQAAIKLKGALLQLTPYVDVVLLEQDCNELLIIGKLREKEAGWRRK